eukprot:TRINITY_DN1661_c0_g1_i2.p1 TRINITY_DN1661_c0_g1~~TRINITY_DN1661_c0_g1_i2.p1  ORF type:complete len:472 (+),score=8.49 TRINITY_DN1661_c0_g1_i2:120-1535(+)
MAETAAKKRHAMVVPHPGQSHITPMLHLSQLLVASFDFQITFVNTAYNQRRISHKNTNPAIQMVGLPDDLPDEFYNNSQTFSKVFAAVNGAPFLQKVDCLLYNTPTANLLITHHFLSWGNHLAAKHRISHALFWSSSAAVSAMFFHYPLLLQKGYCLFAPKEDASGVAFFEGIPGVPATLPVDQMPGFFRTEDESGRLSTFCEMQHRNLSEAKFVLINTSTEIEEEAIRGLINKSAYAIGPLSFPVWEASAKSASSIWSEEKECMEWLQRQAPRSVLYVGFGSLVALKAEQTEELAKGIEASGVPFIWAIKRNAMSAEVERLGKIMREKRMGMVVEWAPQREVLRHVATGAFLSHCGWNSLLESLVCGVPLVCCPLIVDQRTNAWFIEKVWRVGVRLNWDYDSASTRIEKGDVRDKIREIMATDVGAEARLRCQKLCRTIYGGNEDAVSQRQSPSVHHLQRFIGDVTQQVG